MQSESPSKTPLQAVIFDLDGTLVQTERLKAISYARAAVELCPREIREGEVVEAFKRVVGRSRQEVAQALIAQFDLEAAARARMDEFGVATPWQAFIQVRLGHYQALIADPQVLLDNQWPHNIALLQQARAEGCRTALVTMSAYPQARHVLQVLGLEEAFDFIATRDDVERGKPDPEIYYLALSALAVPADESLAIEDSAAGVHAAIAAGVHVIAVATPFTQQALHRDASLDSVMIVDEPKELPQVLERLMRSVA